MSLSGALDLEKAFRRLQQDKRDDVWPDIVGYRDYRRELETNLESLKDKITAPGSYQASLPLGINLPKRGFTLRPGIMPLLEDRILYQAIADLLAPNFHAESCVYSNRLSGDPTSTRMFIQGVQLWLAFQDQVATLCGEYPYVVEADITAYFDHIIHDLLLHRIDDLFRDHVDRPLLREAKQLLQRLWRRWSRGRYRFGIPQVNDPSSFFGNLYLDELDKWMCRHGYIFLRYVDDMRIFAEDEPSARRALADLIVELRKMGLYVASAKTAIKESDEVLEQLGEGRQRIDAIEAELNSGVAERVEEAALLLEQFFTELVDDPNRFNDRHFRYCVNRFKRLRASGLGEEMHARVIDEVLERLKSMPYSTDIFADYLSLFPQDENVQESVLEFLEGPYNIYPWQEMLLLELLIRSDISSDLRDRALEIARAAAHRSGHPACRAKALILWGKNGDYADRREIRSLYYDEPRMDVQRAIVVAIQEMQGGERDNFYRSATSSSDPARMTAQYIQSLPQPTYHYYSPPSGFELMEFYEDSDDLDDLGSEHFLY
jgi:hypothetical protein